MLHLLYGPAASGKTDLLMGRIRTAVAARTPGQVLLVPEQYSHEAERALCAACGDSLSLYAEVLSFTGLARRVAAETGAGEAPLLDQGGRLLCMALALGQVAPRLRLFGAAARRPQMQQTLLGAVDELKTARVTPDALEATAARCPGYLGDKLRDLALVLAAYDAVTAQGHADPTDRLTRLAERIPASALGRTGHFYLDGFTDYTRQELAVVRALLETGADVTVCLTLDALSGGSEIFGAARRTARVLLDMADDCGVQATVEACPARVADTPLRVLEQQLFSYTSAHFDDPAQTITVHTADDLAAECAWAAARALQLVQSGCRWRDIAIAVRGFSDYAPALERMCAYYGVPLYFARRTDLLQKPLVALIRAAYDIVTGGWDAEDVSAYLRTGLAGLTPEETDTLENYVLLWSIRGSAWTRPAPWQQHPDGYGAPWNDRRQAVLTQVNQLRRRVREPLERLAAGLKAGETARDYVEALYSFMEELKLETALTERMHAQAEAGRMQEAEETAQLWEILCGVLDQFVEILGEEHLEQSEFERLFRLVLTQYSVGTIPVALDQVSVSEITRNDRHTTSYLFLLGANDHVLPDPGQSGGLLNEDDRQALALRGVELAPTGMERMGIELQNLYAALAQPTAGLTVSYPVTDVSGSELRPAFVVERLRKLFPELRVEHERADKAYRLSAVEPALEMAGQDPDGPLWRYFQQEPDCARHLSAMERAAAVRRGSLSPAAVRAIYGERVSMTASRLERMRSCHFAYFMEYGLRAKPREPASFDAPQIGTFLHYLLENVTRDVLGQGGFAAVDNKKLHRLTRQYIDQYAEQELHNFQNRTPRFRYLFNRLRTNAYAIIDQVAEELRHSDFVPMAFELGFGGKDGTLPAVTISRPDGELRVGGKVDRVDGWIKDDKLYLRVVDYKSGKKKFDLANVRMGLDIQLSLIHI